MDLWSKKIKIMFWKTIGCIWDVRPRLHLPKYIDYPIASCDIADKYDYSTFEMAGVKILFEWDENGKHWVVFTR
jgi:hypothetical protein